MGLQHVHPAAALECLVVAFQVLGVAGLCVSRLWPGSPWSRRARVGFIVALFGLGVAGALCGRQDSAFALFAGLTLTALLIGMTVGNGPADSLRPATDAPRAEPSFC